MRAGLCPSIPAANIQGLVSSQMEPSHRLVQEAWAPVTLIREPPPEGSLGIGKERGTLGTIKTSAQTVHSLDDGGGGDDNDVDDDDDDCDALMPGCTPQ